MSEEANQPDEQADACPDCLDTAEAVDDAIREDANQRRWLKSLTETYEKIHSAGRYSMPFLTDEDDEDAWKDVGRRDKEKFDKAKARLILERDIALTELCKRITRIVRSDVVDLTE